MITIYTDVHDVHSGGANSMNGKMVPYLDMPVRGFEIANGIRSSAIDDVLLPAQFEIARDQRVPRQPYIEFVSRAWNKWASTRNAAMHYRWRGPPVAPSVSRTHLQTESSGTTP